LPRPWQPSKEKRLIVEALLGLSKINQKNFLKTSFLPADQLLSLFVSCSVMCGGRGCERAITILRTLLAYYMLASRQCPAKVLNPSVARILNSFGGILEILIFVFPES
jgi:hypothetical protein